MHYYIKKKVIAQNIIINTKNKKFIKFSINKIENYIDSTLKKNSKCKQYSNLKFSKK